MLITIDFFWNPTNNQFSSELNNLSDLVSTIEAIEETQPLRQLASDLTELLKTDKHKLNNAFFPFIRIASNVLKTFVPQQNKVEAAVIILSQIAYLQSWQFLLSKNLTLNQIVTEWFENQTTIPLGKEEQNSQNKSIEFDDLVAYKTIMSFLQSPLCPLFNDFLEFTLLKMGIANEDCQEIINNVNRMTSQYMKREVLKARHQQLKEVLIKRYKGKLSDLLDTYRSIDSYLKYVIASQPKEKVYNQDFTFQDIYVNLEVKSVQDDGMIKKNAEAKDIEGWAIDTLTDPTKQDRVLFIQGGPGRGKSLFCRMFADKIRRELYPLWTPILIPLRDIRTLEYIFDKTLQSAVGYRFATNQDWLTNPNNRFLFLLDGFDELVMERGTGKALRDLFDQVSLFQRNAQNSERGHRVLITGRPLALYGVERLMPRNFERVEIIPMEPNIQQNWFNNWENIYGKHERKAFGEFIKNCPEPVQIMAKEPLLLYLLAVMNRDPSSNIRNFNLEGNNDVDVKISIHRRVLEWVLNKQREDKYIRNLGARLAGFEPDDIRIILEEAGLCRVQLDREVIKLDFLAKRLIKVGGRNIKYTLDEAPESEVNDILKNALVSFYFKGGEDSVEFIHKSFGEFLFAERLAKRLKAWTRSDDSNIFYIEDSQMQIEFYDLFGYGGLNPEIVEYLMALLTTNTESQDNNNSQQLQSNLLVNLFRRLEEFYNKWSKGEYINSRQPFPLFKSQEMRDYDNFLGQREIDIYAGLNVIILLQELQHYAKSQTQDSELRDNINFYLCGNPEQLDSNKLDQKKEDPTTRLFRHLGYSFCINEFLFSDTVGPYLQGANLQKAKLDRAYLVNANLRNADFQKARLNSAYLLGSNLSGANLSEADLRGVNLDQANLESANLGEAQLNISYLRKANFANSLLIKAQLCDSDLRKANLSGADLTEANLSGADLSGADLSGANLTNTVFSDLNFGDIRWSKQTKWGNVEQLLKNPTIPERLRDELSNS
ncbi:MAG: pentapeptide repeat-containing protein [Xenococcus sp. MO_188.B8]|nr:pentapeptide repeat-containing protein [Xenococcus sp. MO_188.B8]